MYNNLEIKDAELASLSEKPNEKFDMNGNLQVEQIKYLSNSVRLSFDALIALTDCTKVAFGIYIAMFMRLAYNTNVITISRQEFKEFVKATDSGISKGIKELVKHGLIKLKGKDTFMIPINVGVKGNVNAMVKRYEHEKEEQERFEKELEANKVIASFKDISMFRKAIRNKIELNNDDTNKEKGVIDDKVEFITSEDIKVN